MIKILAIKNGMKLYNEYDENIINIKISEKDFYCYLYNIYSITKFGKILFLESKLTISIQE